MFSFVGMLRSIGAIEVMKPQILRYTDTMVNKSPSQARYFQYHRRIDNRLRGLNQPARIYAPRDDVRTRECPPESELISGCTRNEWREQKSLMKLQERGPPNKRKTSNPLGGRPQIRGIVLKTLIKKPKKPNSANRKCVYVRLTTGKEVTCYVPGIGHNLQEHSTVLVHYKRTPDVPGLKLRVIRGVYDCAMVFKQTS